LAAKGGGKWRNETREMARDVQSGPFNTGAWRHFRRAPIDDRRMEWAFRTDEERYHFGGWTEAQTRRALWDYDPDSGKPLSPTTRAGRALGADTLDAM
jgi:hypothetical protein